MLRALTMYGPDASASETFGPIALGRDLARLLPEDRYDHQPLVGAGGRYALVADLRLDNRDELAADLGVSAGQAAMACDTQVLLWAVERWGVGAVERLVGDFAFALWDAERHELALARDRFGHRPLFYHRAGRFFAFATMAKGLHALPEVPYAANAERVIDLVALLPEEGSASVFEGIERVEPGCVLTVSEDGVASRRYWRAPSRLLRLKRPEDYQEALREVFDKAVSAQLRGTGDVGSQLSGGLDSSSVTATAARLLAGGERRLIAFTGAPRAGYDVPDAPHSYGDETAHAAATAALYPNIEHVVVRTPPASVLHNIDRLMLLYETPPPNLPNQRWMGAIRDAAKARGLKVLLTGDMGNMTISFDGMQLLNELFWSGRWLRLFQEGAALERAGHRSWLGVAAQLFGPMTPAPVWRWLVRGRTVAGETLTTYTALAEAVARSPEFLRKARRRGYDIGLRPRSDALGKRLLVIGRSDVGVLRKGNLAGWGLDQRDPTADTRVLDFCLSVPTEQYLRNGVPRALVRGAFADRLPAMVLDERRAGRQAADWHEGLEAARADLETELRRLSADASARRVIDVDRLSAAVEDWPTGGWRRREIEARYQFALLRGVSAGFFMRKVAGGNEMSVDACTRYKREWRQEQARGLYE